MIALRETVTVVAGIGLLQSGVHASLVKTGQKPLDFEHPQDTDYTEKNPFTTEVDILAREIMGEWHVPGVSMAVVDGSKTYAKGFGFATLPDTPATPETLYYVGSTTKAQTAAVLSHFIDIKRFPELAGGWSTPISSIIRDDFVLQDEWSTAHITLDDAVSHRTGMPGHDNSWHREINGTQATIRDIVRNGRNLPYTVAPRTSWHYCNYMFITLSHVIEVLTGQWLGQVLQELIWDPLGMSSTYMDLDKAKDSSAHLATSYVWRNDEEKYDELPYLGVKEINGAGGVISNVLDYSKWLRCLINETEPFSKAVHNDIKTPRFIANSQPGLESDVSLYSLGWIRTTIHGQVVYWHSGSTATFGALVYWLPDLHYGIVAFGNGALVSKEVELVLVRKLLEDKLQIPVQDRPDINKLQKKRALQRQYRLEKADDILYPDRPKQSLPPSIEVDQMVGNYFNPGYGSFSLFKKTISDDPNAIIFVANRTELTWAQQWRLHHVSSNYWTLYSKLLLGINEIEGYYAAEFVAGVDGKVSSFQVQMYDQDLDINEGTIVFEKI